MPRRPSSERRGEMMQWKALALDLDGTTLNSKEEISSHNLDAIFRAAQAGVKVFVATGRSYTSASRYVEILNTGDPSITYNGALIRDSASVLRSLTMEDGIIQDILRTLKRLQQQPVVYTTLESRYVDEPEKLHRNFFDFSKGSGIRNIEVDDLLTQSWDDVIRISVFTDEYTTQLLDAELQRRFGSSVKTAQTYFSEWDFWIFEVLNAQCSKPEALQFLCNRYGFEHKEVIAVGDNRNDVEMIHWAGLGVAMRNSLPDVAAAADYVTRATNNEHGVAEVIERFILKG
jgi:Cof subfamily protein (haloacid dehalogenase superfamily)